MIGRLVSLIILSATLAACTHATFNISPPMPSQTDISQVPQNSMPIYLNIVMVNVVSPAWETAIKREFGTVFSEVIPHSYTMPDNGVYCLLKLESRFTAPPPIDLWQVLSNITLGAIPFYAHTYDYIVNYTVYIDSQKKKSYEYSVSETEFTWILASLWNIARWGGSWVDEVTWKGPPALNEAVFKRTTKAFLFEAHRDGYL